jgi:valyl-tRNA synthetase
MTDLAPQYDASGIEPPLYREWLERGLFTPDPRSPARPFVIVIPPPNVTGILHMGHGLNNTVQDVVVRFERMRGRDTLWVPGTDHAGIATQNVVERQVAKESGKTRFELGREAFVRRAEAFVAANGSTIIEQLKALGCSCDWTRTAYTLSPALSRAVREVFVRLWEEGLIYRGHRIIHWCPRCLTSLSDEEAEHSERDGHLYHIRYPLEDGRDHVTVATTRPETLLGDVAVAVNPEDEDKQRFVGKMVKLPIAGVAIPVIADAAVELGFGSGFLKITPAHDANDFEVGRRHNLPAPVILTPDARMADAALEGRAGGRVPEHLFGLDRYEARRVILEQLKEQKLLAKVEPYRHALRVCYRCHTTVEPRLSDQWFVKMAPLATPALAAYRKGEVRFIPERRGNDYEQWLTNIRDWNISRQLWWGHRIPIWYCDACGTQKAYREDPAACGTCGGPLRQDEDVLDTWFSSWLWPFSTLGWPDQTPDLRRYYPTDVLVTDPDIIFFWVARMIFAGIHFMGRVPFHTVYIHGTARDMQHRRMSKSLGNGIDPLDAVEQFGADALRFTLVNGLAVGTDILMDPDDLDTTFATGRNFANKLWNIGRLVLGNLKDGAPGHRGTGAPWNDSELQPVDRWILSRLNRAIGETTAHLEKFRLNDAAGAPYHFLWDDFADWYLEAIKPRLYGEEPGGEVARAVAAHCFDTVLRLLHPVMPFITEYLWQRLPGNAGRNIAVAPWPTADAARISDDAERHFTQVQDLVSAVRQTRADFGVPPGKVVTTSTAGFAAWAALEPSAPLVRRLAKTDLARDPIQGPAAQALLRSGESVRVALDAADAAKECARLRGEHTKLERQLAGLRGKLSNEGFLAKAPPEVVEAERTKERDWREKLARLERQVQELGC